MGRSNGHIGPKDDMYHEHELSSQIKVQDG